MSEDKFQAWLKVKDNWIYQIIPMSVFLLILYKNFFYSLTQGVDSDFIEALNQLHPLKIFSLLFIYYFIVLFKRVRYFLNSIYALIINLCELCMSLSYDYRQSSAYVKDLTKLADEITDTPNTKDWLASLVCKVPQTPNN